MILGVWLVLDRFGRPVRGYGRIVQAHADRQGAAEAAAESNAIYGDVGPFAVAAAELRILTITNDGDAEKCGGPQNKISQDERGSDPIEIVSSAFIRVHPCLTPEGDPK